MLTTVLPLLAAPAAPAAPVTAHAAGCPGLDALNPVCQLGSLGGTVAGAGVDAVLSGLSQWVASGAEWLLSQIGDVLVSTTTIDIGASWFRQHYAVMTALAGVVVLPLLVVSTLQAVYRQSASQLLRAFFVQLPLAMLLGVVAIQIVLLCLSATDAMCAAVAGGSGSDVKALLSGVTHGLISAVGDPTMATFVLLLVGLLVAAASFVLWLELLVRAAAVYVAVLFLPMALATLVWPSVSHWCRRLVETLAALILSKFVIVATLSLAAGAVSSGTAGAGDAGSGFASVLAGGALLVLATFVPFAILRLIPAVEAGAVSHLEGARQRGTSALTRVPRTAAAFALNEGMAAHGAAKLATRAGPAGTGGVGGLGGGGGGSDGGGGGGVSGQAEPDVANGGLIPNADGVMVGLPSTNAAYEEAMASDSGSVPRPRGPKPVRAVPGRPSEEPAYLGLPQPHGRRYAMGRDAMGPVIRYLPAPGESSTAPGTGASWRREPAHYRFGPRERAGPWPGGGAARSSRWRSGWWSACWCCTARRTPWASGWRSSSWWSVRPWPPGRSVDGPATSGSRWSSGGARAPSGRGPGGAAMCSAGSGFSAPGPWTWAWCTTPEPGP